MRYFKLISAVLVISAIFIGAGTKEVKLTEGIWPGNLAPELNWQDIDRSECDYVLVQAWETGNPKSRIDNVRMHNTISNRKDTQVQFVSVCIDGNEAIYKGIVRTDGLEKTNQFFAPELKQTTLFKKTDFATQQPNWLINSQGVIVAANLSPEELTQFLTAKN